MCPYSSRFCPWFECESTCNTAYPRAPRDMTPAATKPMSSLSRNPSDNLSQSLRPESQQRIQLDHNLAMASRSNQSLTSTHTSAHALCPKMQDAFSAVLPTQRTQTQTASNRQALAPLTHKTYRAFVTRDLAFRSRFLPALFFSPATIETLIQGFFFCLAAAPGDAYR